MPPKKDRQRLSEHEEGFVAVFAGENPPRSQSAEPQRKKKRKPKEAENSPIKGKILGRISAKIKTPKKSDSVEDENPSLKKGAPKPAGKRVVQDDSSSESEDSIYEEPVFTQRKRARPAAMRRHGITIPAVKTVLPKDSLRTMTKRRSFHMPARPFSSYLSMPPTSLTARRRL